MRQLGGELLAGARLSAPGSAAELIGALCGAYSRRRGGRKVDFRFASFPPDTASGLWLEMDERDLIVVEERTAPSTNSSSPAMSCGTWTRGPATATDRAWPWPPG
ncbi:hypothetical protein WKI68_09075 [Streptomyces sp. MS1.HAVA.3]|uniref:Uncharacterized protein n=1 Tax=Streptomyces caledonius TaxID=3134107 RepID=A0ABU8U141_9ACTN